MPVASPLVLVVENDRIWRETLIQMLEDLGHRVVSADSGFAAQEKLLNMNDIEIIISTILLPDLTGPDLFSWERKNFKTRLKSRVFVFISGITNSKESNLAKELGVDLFLTRPIDPDFLEPVMNKAVLRI